MISVGLWSRSFERKSLLLPATAPRQGAFLLRGSATRERRLAGGLNSDHRAVVKAGALRRREIPLLRGSVNSDLPRKAVTPPAAAPYAHDLRRGSTNSDRSRKPIVTSHARSKDDDRYALVRFLLECSSLPRNLPGNGHIRSEYGVVKYWHWRGPGEYGPLTQAIETVPASNSDLTRKGIVTWHASNSDRIRKRIETASASNSDLTRKYVVRTSCKTACFAVPDRAPLLCVCMFSVPDVYRKGGRGWG